MSKLFEDLSVSRLQQILAHGRPEAPLAHLTASSAISRRRLARRNGLWQSLDRTLESPAAPIPVLKRSDYRSYSRTGSRIPSVGLMHHRRNQVLQNALALWLNHPKASVERLKDMLWALCDDFSWVIPPHENCVLDLAASDTGAALADVLGVVGHRLEAEVVQRVRAQLESRILLLYNHRSNWWRKSPYNWNHVCHGNIIRVALAIRHDSPKLLAPLVHSCVRAMQLALDGFTDDGGCVEGPRYWVYGFGHFVSAAYALHAFTAGKINLMTADAKIERICKFPLAVHIAADVQAPFADTSPGYIPAEIPLLINKFFQLPQLFSLCRTHSNRDLALANWNELALYKGQKSPRLAPTDSLLPQLRVARIRSAPGPRQVTVIATAGDNGCSHNHNDIGSFVAFRAAHEWLTDPGAPVYSANTFTQRRYENLFCNSLGHSVPLINGRQQSDGRQFFGSLQAHGLHQKNDKRIVINMTRAYPPGTVESLIRTLALNYTRHALEILDAYRFDHTPREIIETFITFQHVRISRAADSVQISAGRKMARLTAAQPGKFALVSETEASKTGRGGKLVRRILFQPAAYQPVMNLQFHLTWN